MHYSIDSDDRIDFFDRPFTTFATDNGVTEDEVVDYMGRPIYSFLAGAETKSIYRVVIEKARSGRTLTFPFRCDAPSLRRYLVMTVEPAAHSGVAFLTRLLKVENRLPVRLLETAALRSHELVRMCSWCKRIVVDDDYTEVDDAVSRLKLFNQDPVPGITHGICNPCRRDVLSREPSQKKPH